MLQQTLQKLGLDKKEIEIYLQLLRIGPNRASVLAYQLKLPRTTVQNILIRLEEAKLVTKILDKNSFTFAATHPDNLPQIVEMQMRKSDYEFTRTIEELKKLTPELLGMMRSNKALPSVKFYRGLDGVREVLFDTLKSKTDLKDFANIDAMFEFVKPINDEYVAAREKTNIKKRSLLLDTPFAHKVYESGKYSPKSHLGYKWIDRELYPFTIEMNIYDGKVSYLTYVKDDFVGVIIENEHIYRMHDSIWNMLWDFLPEVKGKKISRKN